MNDLKNRANALRLMQALVAAGAQPDEDMANARITDVAVAAGLDGQELDEALVYAGSQGWIDNEPSRPGWTRATAAGIAAGSETNSARRL
jgi:hypothetical protein